ncbi:hypothetical protein BCR33DRAFT_765390 [Rhizoclosmatium globosum]|uniref:Wax synthase domain-containing protein n=1 Tax=Rhizoclosmatium globosum TaxID=329046 RepID=A0A1Y2CER9_9FUNG|nr:hypothetical protein BCR33DRAFT_765390 [Rhizoclosmatium globosum]|eukprot:ORY45560.1 hypothetical protein BCR33DRAFT_765390 [Rhizoclosmatium globosum]
MAAVKYEAVLIDPIASIPPWASAIILFGLIPSMHLTLLHSTSIPSFAVTILSTSLFFFIPNLLECDEQSVDFMWKGLGCVYFLLRSLEIGSFPRSVTSKWTAAQYFEFLFTSDNEPLRRYRKEEALKEVQACQELGLPLPKPKENGPYVTEPSGYGIWFFVKLLGEMLCCEVLYCFAKGYLAKYPYREYGPFLALWDLEGVVVHAVFAVLLMTELNMTYTFSTLPVTIMLNAPFVHMFNNPFLSTSLADFWSHRWNYPIKETMYRLGFVPTITLLSWFDPPSNSGHKVAKPKQPVAHYAIASVVALLHRLCFMNTLWRSSLLVRNWTKRNLLHFAWTAVY